MGSKKKPPHNHQSPPSGAPRQSKQPQRPCAPLLLAARCSLLAARCSLLAARFQRANSPAKVGRARSGAGLSTGHARLGRVAWPLSPQRRRVPRGFSSWVPGRRAAGCRRAAAARSEGVAGLHDLPSIILHVSVMAAPGREDMRGSRRRRDGAPVSRHHQVHTAEVSSRSIPTSPTMLATS